MVHRFVRSRVSRRNTVVDRRALRMEHLEPRLVLSTASILQQLASAGLTSGSAVTLGAAADAYVSSNTPVTNYGKSTDLLVQSNGPAASSETYLKFNLGGISGSVTKAVLNLTALAASSSTSSITISVQLLKDANDNWVEGSGGTNRGSTGAITWANSVDGAGTIVTTTITAAQLKKSASIAIDVTQLINQTLNTNGVASFVVKATSSFGAMALMDFASRDSAIAAYRPTLTVTTAGQSPTVAQQPTITSQTNTTVSLSVLGADADSGETNLTYTWSVTSPAGATSPAFSSNGTNSAKKTTVTFSQAGAYVFTAKITDNSGLSVTSSSITVTVGQVLTNLAISPSSVSLAIGATQQFTVSGADQFGKTMGVTAGSVTWSASTGSFSSGTKTNTVTYVAPSSATTGTITATAKSNSLTATAKVTVAASNFLGLLDSILANLTQSLDVDGSINRADMIAILTTVADEADGVVDATDLSDLKTILKNSTTLCMANYVLDLAGDVVNGNTANAYYLGTTLGNLAIGSANANLDKLINKWFYGADLPATGGYSYDTATAGTLFGSTIASHADELQGNLGDCYLIAALGSIADSSQTAIANMFLYNGDGTWTVRFYVNGTADYVTVNSRLPVDSKGNLIFQGYGSSSTNTSNELWLSLLEKAYAQWNETGNTGRDQALNSYVSIEGGWMGDVYAQALGHAAASYSMTNSAQQTLINAVTGGKAVTIGTVSSPTSGTGLYGNHAYNIIAYSSSTGLFTLYNPWGSNQPNQLTWSQLTKSCQAFAVADTSGSVALSAIKQAIIRTFVLSPTNALAATPANTAGVLVFPSSASSSVNASADVQNPARLSAASVDALFADHGVSTGGQAPSTRTAMHWLKAEPFPASVVFGEDEDLVSDDLFGLDAVVRFAHLAVSIAG